MAGKNKKQIFISLMVVLFSAGCFGGATYLLSGKIIASIFVSLGVVLLAYSMRR